MKAVIDGNPVQIDGQNVQVYFTYGKSELSLMQGPTTVRSVECVIRPFPATKDEETVPFSIGVANCSPQDNFNRAAGRLLAWRRATANPRFSRDEKRALWSWFTSTIRLPSNTTL